MGGCVGTQKKPAKTQTTQKVVETRPSDQNPEQAQRRKQLQQQQQRKRQQQERIRKQRQQEAQRQRQIQLQRQNARKSVMRQFNRYEDQQENHYGELNKRRVQVGFNNNEPPRIY